MNVIETSDLTKNYGDKCGIFDLNLSVAEGEMVGYVGTNGSGKTTTIRHIMGFLKPTSGTVHVMGLSSWEHSSEIVKNVGYVPGEIAFPDLKTGIEFLKCQADFLKLKNMSYANELIERLQLDPLMRTTFLDIIKEEHSKGKTIFMSSHSFDELEKTCDRVALINKGHIVDICDMKDIRCRKVKDFKIEFHAEEDYHRFLNERYEKIRLQRQYNQVTIRINSDETAPLLGILKNYNVKFISELPYTLEMHFKNILLSNSNKS